MCNAVLLLEVAMGAKSGTVGPALLVLEGLLRTQQQPQTPMPAKLLKVGKSLLRIPRSMPLCATMSRPHEDVLCQHDL